MAVDRPRDEAVDVHCMARGRDIADSLAAAEEGRAVAVVDTVDGGPAVAAVKALRGSKELRSGKGSVLQKCFCGLHSILQLF